MTQKKLKIAVMSVRAKFISFILLLEWSFISPSYAQTLTQSMSLYKKAVPEAISKQYPVLPYNFMDLIKAIPKPLPASLKEFQKIFNNKFQVVIDKDRYSILYVTNSFITLDGVIIKRVEIDVSPKIKGEVNRVSIDFDNNQCVNSQILKKEFGFLIPVLLSMHPIPNAPMNIYTSDEWGKFAMGTTMDFPNCATGIGILSFSDKQEKRNGFNMCVSKRHI